ncbi:SDR family NAD(P)-dependent oxidoreductase [Pseudoprimorskyibacter insulae]|uniref:2-keto-3-deoxy-L-fuconate dehydrogenase n=1 Tax=Pseudoprimorskyibacter insulae TaxID=1695997 RepID=A0A2R8AZR8_9RHOB|nr:SDR family oxidoreductase [Pseudoprimorskyibacter insulae]SPF81518.1 2-keto-3-deoxy-L-fuconate dehydrogenase [Pseudoprimorskyibacter insulae]
MIDTEFFPGLSGRVALVTGAASGVGQAVTESLLRYGVIVAGLDITAEGIPQGAKVILADVRDQAAVTKAIDDFAASHGCLDVLVNNAGVSYTGKVEDGDEADWSRVFDINVFGQLRVMRAALPWLRKSGSASVIVMSSCTAINGIPERVVYSATKGAVQSMSIAMATDLVAEGIRVNTISPGTVDTPFMRELASRTPDPAATRAAHEARQPTGKMVDPNEIGLAVAYLASTISKSVTGTTLVVDGGMGALRLAAKAKQ